MSVIGVLVVIDEVWLSFDIVFVSINVTITFVVFVEASAEIVSEWVLVVSVILVVSIEIIASVDVVFIGIELIVFSVVAKIYGSELVEIEISLIGIEEVMAVSEEVWWVAIDVSVFVFVKIVFASTNGVFVKVVSESVVAVSVDFLVVAASMLGEVADVTIGEVWIKVVTFWLLVFISEVAAVSIFSVVFVGEVLIAVSIWEIVDIGLVDELAGVAVVVVIEDIIVGVLEEVVVT